MDRIYRTRLTLDAAQHDAAAQRSAQSIEQVSRSTDALSRHLELAASASATFERSQQAVTATEQRATQAMLAQSEAARRQATAPAGGAGLAAAAGSRLGAAAAPQVLGAPPPTAAWQDALGNIRRAAAGSEQQLAALRRGSQLTSQQLTQVGFQLNDFAVQVASGGGVLIPLIQQGSQLAGTFGGVTNAGKALLSLLTPLRVGVIGLVGASAGFALAAARTEDWQRELGNLQATLAGTGRGGQFSNSELGALIEQISQAPGVTREAATKSVAELARVNEIGRDLLRNLAGVAADYARVTGTDVASASKTLASAFAEPAQGAKQLEGTLGTLSSATLLTVQRLAEQGDRVGAQRALYEGLEGAVRGLASEGLTPLQRATTDLGNAWDRTMGAFRESDSLKGANALLAEMLGLMAKGIEKLPELEQRARSAFKGTIVGAPAALLDSLTGRNQAQAGGAGGDWQMPPAAASQPAVPAGAARQEVDATDQRIKAALKLGDAYKTQAGEIAALVARQKILREALALAAPGSEQARALQDRITGVGERLASMRRRGSSGRNEGEAEARALRRAEQSEALRDIEEGQQRERDVLSQHLQLLDAQYRAGEVSLEGYYAARERAERQAERNTAAGYERQLELLAAFQDEALNAGDPVEFTRLDKDISAVLNRQAREEEAAAARRKVSDVQARDARLQQKAATDELAASIRALAGDESALAALRRDQAVQQAGLVLSQGGVDPRAAAEQLARYRQLLEVQDGLRQRQDELQQLYARGATEEERFLLEAERRGLSLQEIEQGLYERRSAQLQQLGQLRDAVAELARVSGDPRVAQQAAEIGVAYQRALRSVDPAIERLRDGLQGLADRTADSIGSAIAEFRSLRDVAQSVLQDIQRFVIDQMITAPLKQALRGLIEPNLGGVASALGIGGQRAAGANAQAGAVTGFAGGALAQGIGIGSEQPSEQRDLLRQMEAATAEQIAQTVAVTSAQTAATAAVTADTTATTGSTAALVALQSTGIATTNAALGSLTLAANAAAAALQMVAAGGGSSGSGGIASAIGDWFGLGGGGEGTGIGLPGVGDGGAMGFPFAKGGGFVGGGLRAYAKGGSFAGGSERGGILGPLGGLLERPTLFPMRNGGIGLGGEAGTEAVMPLKRTANGQLGVIAQVGAQVAPALPAGGVANGARGGGSAAAPVVNMPVHVHNHHAGAAVRTQQRPDGGLDVIVDEIERRMGGRIDSGTGLATNISGRFGLNSGAALPV